MVLINLYCTNVCLQFTVESHLLPECQYNHAANKRVKFSFSFPVVQLVLNICIYPEYTINDLSSSSVTLS